MWCRDLGHLGEYIKYTLEVLNDGPIVREMKKYYTESRRREIYLKQ